MPSMGDVLKNIQTGKAAHAFLMSLINSQQACKHQSRPGAAHLTGVRRGGVEVLSHTSLTQDGHHCPKGDKASLTLGWGRPHR